MTVQTLDRTSDDGATSFQWRARQSRYAEASTGSLDEDSQLIEQVVRFAFDTHHHGDHAYGNQVWADNGAVPVAQENVLAEMRKYETGLFGGKPGRWEDEAKQREDMKNTRLKAPTPTTFARAHLLYP